MQKYLMSTVSAFVFALLLPVQASVVAQTGESSSPARAAKEAVSSRKVMVQDQRASLGENKSGDDKQKPAKTQEKEAKLTGRLPRYFGKVVDDNQRQRIYEIQAEYRQKVTALQQQLDQAKAAELEAIEGVLQPGQLEQLKKLRSAAQMQRSEKTRGSASGN